MQHGWVKVVAGLHVCYKHAPHAAFSQPVRTSSADTEISLAFSSASCLMNFTIWSICRSTCALASRFGESDQHVRQACLAYRVRTSVSFIFERRLCYTIYTFVTISQQPASCTARSPASNAVWRGSNDFQRASHLIAVDVQQRTYYPVGASLAQVVNLWHSGNAHFTFRFTAT